VVRVVAGVAVAASLLLAGCGEERMKAMVGKSSDDLIAAWGPPTQVLESRDGGTIWVYTQAGSFTLPGSETTTTDATARRIGRTVVAEGESRTTSTPPQSFTVVTNVMFWVGKDGVVTRYAQNSR
jgi:hypothetical protein